ncbi:MAG TPA: DUF2513 domain-containing protein [Tepidisphaeraceae bacterium]|jgi:hypothetical protein
MKRDMDLIRKILQQLEEHPAGNAPESVAVDGTDPLVVGYHCALLVEAGLVDGAVQDNMGESPTATIHRLTWQGHEFLDASRSDALWNKVKTAAAIGGGAAFQTITRVLIESGHHALMAHLA